MGVESKESIMGASLQSVWSRFESNERIPELEMNSDNLSKTFNSYTIQK
jgi:hypothetical protein